MHPLFQKTIATYITLLNYDRHSTFIESLGGILHHRTKHHPARLAWVYAYHNTL